MHHVLPAEAAHSIYLTECWISTPASDTGPSSTAKVVDSAHVFNDSSRITDEISVVTAPHLWFAKRVWPNRTEQYSRAKHVDIRTVRVSGLDDIAALLAKLIADPRSAVMRGALIDPTRWRNTRRLLYQHRDGTPPSIREVPRPWVGLDIEGITRPDHVAATDLAGCAAVALARLPPAFRAARCIVQATASHGIKPDIRLRLWFWLARPVTAAELQRWLAGTPADPAAFGAAVPLYTSAPVFMGGAVDPLPCRLADLPGNPAVAVPSAEDLAPPPEPIRPASDPREPAPEKLIEAIIQGRIDAVRSAAPGQKHAAIRAAAVTLGGIQDRGGFSDSEALGWLLDAIAAPASRRKDEDTVRWGLDRGRARPLELATRRQPPPAVRLGEGTRTRHGAAIYLPAYFPAPTEPRDLALARQEKLIREAVASAEKLAAARIEVIRRREAEIAGRDLSSGRRGAITRRHARAVAEEQGYGRKLPLPDRLLITGNQGGGKTSLSIEAVAAIRAPITVWLTEPTLEKAEEVARDYRRIAAAESLPAMVVRGRGQMDPARPGRRMCERSETAARVAKAGLSVTESMCLACPFREDCGYREQARRITALPRGAVFFLASHQIFVPSPAPPADLLIVDEQITLLAAEAVKIPWAALDPRGLPSIPEQVRENLDLLRTALLTRHPLESIRRAGLDRTALRVMIDCLDGALTKWTPAIDGGMADADIDEALDRATVRTAIMATLSFIRAVRREIDAPRRVLNAVYAVDQKTGPVITVSRMQRPNGIKRAAVLALDGTGDAGLNRHLFGDRLRHERVALDRLGTVTGTIRRSYSRMSVSGRTGDGEIIRNRAAGAARLRQDIATIREDLPGSVAVFAPKDAIAVMLETGELSPDAPSGHFGAVRGLNSWEHCRAAVVVGATSLTVGDLEDTARAFMAEDPVPFISMDHLPPPGWRRDRWPYVATRMRRMRDGRTSPVEVEIHPDPRCQSVLEQLREAEAIQAGDRTRPVFNHRDLVFLNNLALDVTYDRVMPHRQLVAGGNRLELTFRKFGLLPLGGRDLHRLDPARYRTIKAAEHALKELPGNTERETIYNSGEFFYRVDHQHGLASRALIDADRHPDPVAALRFYFGKITEFQGLRTAEPDRIPGQRPAAALGWHPGADPGPATVPHTRPLTHAPPSV